MNLVAQPESGCIVEFMQGNSVCIAWVQEVQGAKLRVLTSTKRESVIALSRVLPWWGPCYGAGKNRQEQLTLLAEHNAKREELSYSAMPQKAQDAALELWDLAQGEVESASAKWFAELQQEAPDTDSIAAIGRMLLVCKTHFKFQTSEFEVYSAEKVANRLAEAEAKKRQEQLVSEGHEFIRALWETHLGKRTPPAAPQEGDVAERLEALIRERIADPDAHDNAELWKQLVRGLAPAGKPASYGASNAAQGQNPAENSFLPILLGQAWGIIPPHYNYLLDRADYSSDRHWDAAYLDDMVATEERAQTAQAELPFVDLPFLSIDSATTRDIDDAFALQMREGGGYTVSVAIACPPLGWDFESRLNKAVQYRATSIYLPEGNLHMLPESLGIDYYSLSAESEKAAFIMDFAVAADGTLESCDVRAGRIQLVAQLTYEDCEAVLDALQEGEAALAAEMQNGNPAVQYKNTLKQGIDLAHLLQGLRIANGAIVIERPDPQLVLQGEGKNITVDFDFVRPAPEAMLIVSELMVLCNHAVAEWAIERHIPLLFRTQDVAVPKEYAGIWSEAHEIARIVKALSPALLETRPRLHAGLGVTAYSPMTSPLRRYADFMNVAQILHYLGAAGSGASTAGTPRWQLEELEALLPAVSRRLDAAGQVQRFRPRYWKLLLVKQKGDKIWWDAVVTEENDAFVSVALPEQQLFVRARRSLFGERIGEGMPVMVRLGKVNPLFNEIQIIDVMEA